MAGIVKIRMSISCAGEFEGKTYSLQGKKEYDLPKAFAEDLINARYAVLVKSRKTERSTSKKEVEKNVL